MDTAGHLLTEDLKKSVGFILAECLQEVVELRPEDPIHFIAQWLYAHANSKIYFEDKSTFLMKLRSTAREMRRQRRYSKVIKMRRHAELMKLQVLQGYLTPKKSARDSSGTDIIRRSLYSPRHFPPGRIKRLFGDKISISSDIDFFRPWPEWRALECDERRLRTDGVLSSGSSTDSSSRGSRDGDDDRRSRKAHRHGERGRSHHSDLGDQWRTGSRATMYDSRHGDFFDDDSSEDEDEDGELRRRRRVGRGREYSPGDEDRRRRGGLDADGYDVRSRRGYVKGSEDRLSERQSRRKVLRKKSSQKLDKFQLSTWYLAGRPPVMVCSHPVLGNLCDPHFYRGMGKRGPNEQPVPTAYSCQVHYEHELYAVCDIQAGR